MVLERVKDYWGKDLPHSIGQDNFDELRFEFFRDDTVGREAFKGDQLDWLPSAAASNGRWPTIFPRSAKACHQGKIPDREFGADAGYAFNLRRPLVHDVRVRRAFNFALDWEEMDRQLSNGEYHRDGSYFDGIPEFMPGFPKVRNCRFSKRCATRCPPKYSRRPTRIRSAAIRRRLATICAKHRLVKEAGFEVRDRKLVNAAGKPVSVEFLSRTRATSGAVFLQAISRAARHHREYSHRR